MNRDEVIAALECAADIIENMHSDFIQYWDEALLAKERERYDAVAAERRSVVAALRTHAADLRTPEAPQ